MAVDITILVVTRNRADELRATLFSILQAGLPEGKRAELLVVDNGSTDCTRSVVEAAKASSKRIAVRYVLAAQGGKSAGLNAGLRECLGRAILFTDDDVRVPTEWIAQMSQPILGNMADIVGGAVRIASHLLRSWMTPTHRSWLASTEQLDMRCDSPVGANMAIARRVLDLVPGFDERLGPGPGALGTLEETVFCMQARAMGFRVHDVLVGEVEHHFRLERLTRDSMLSAATGHGRSMAYVMWTYQGVRLPFLGLRRTKHALLSAWRRRRGRTEMDHATLDELEQAKGAAFFDQFRLLSRTEARLRLQDAMRS